ncbi:MAG: MerR family transcriptional regulator [Bdellovibrionaceae bacterium]|nr:MerR family transcriptional regulator [Pseudobdellovibrionaceae bacterium]
MDIEIDQTVDEAGSMETNELVQAVVFDVEGSRLLEKMFARIPDQMAFKIGDVAELADVKPYVLRYWEQEFDILKPKKATNNQRMYSRRDVENVLMVKKFLHIDKFSIPGARRAIKLARKKMASGVMDVAKGPSEKDIKALEIRMEMLLSKIRSTKGKLVHKFFQLGL